MPIDLQRGIFFALAAGCLWGICPLLLKRGMRFSNVSTATLIQQYVGVSTLFTLAAFRGELFPLRISLGSLAAFVGAGVVGASFGKIFYFKGIDKVGASKATSVKNSSPILTTFLAVVLLGEELTLPIGVGVLLIVAGIWFLSRGESERGTGVGRISYFFYPLMAALCFGINPVFKKLGVAGTQVPILGALITQSTGLIMMLTAGRMLKIQPKWERVPTKSLIFFLVAGVSEGVASMLTFFALLYAPAVLVSPIWRISPLVTFVLARFTLKGIEVVTLKDGLAAAFIVGGIFVLTQG
jgi:DME family drug/metabolite transporter